MLPASDFAERARKEGEPYTTLQTVWSYDETGMMLRDQFTSSTLISTVL
jgi:hypothetical protein